MDTKTRATGASVLLAVGGLLAGLILLAGPAGALTSGGANAANGSTSSGTGTAVNGSTVSGAANAANGSTSSGCATAVNGSTASGGTCAHVTPVTPVTPVHPVVPGPSSHHVVVPATHAQATPAARLAFTGSSTGPLAVAGAIALALGTMLLVLGSERRRGVQGA